MHLASTVRSIRAKIRRSFAHRGVLGTLAYVPEFAVYLLKSLNPQRRRWNAEITRQQQQFDREHQVDTAGLVQLSELEVVGQHRELGHYYLGTDPQVFQRLMQQLPIAHQDYVFVDYGSGKGKAMLLAALWPFRAVVGIEFAAALHQVALRNMRSFHHPGQQCHQLQPLHQDATEYTLPDAPLVVYFYNPFSETVLAAVLARMESSLRAQPRDLWVCYKHPYAHAPLDAAGFLSLVVAHPQYRIYRARNMEVGPGL